MEMTSFTVQEIHITNNSDIISSENFAILKNDCIFSTFNGRRYQVVWNVIEGVRTPKVTCLSSSYATNVYDFFTRPIENGLLYSTRAEYIERKLKEEALRQHQNNLQHPDELSPEDFVEITDVKEPNSLKQRLSDIRKQAKCEVVDFPELNAVEFESIKSEYEIAIVNQKMLFEENINQLLASLEPLEYSIDNIDVNQCVTQLDDINQQLSQLKSDFTHFSQELTSLIGKYIQAIKAIANPDLRHSFIQRIAGLIHQLNSSDANEGLSTFNIQSKVTSKLLLNAAMLKNMEELLMPLSPSTNFDKKLQHDWAQAHAKRTAWFLLLLSDCTSNMEGIKGAKETLGNIKKSQENQLLAGEKISRLRDEIKKNVPEPDSEQETQIALLDEWIAHCNNPYIVVHNKQLIKIEQEINSAIAAIYLTSALKIGEKIKSFVLQHTTRNMPPKCINGEMVSMFTSTKEKKLHITTLLNLRFECKGFNINSNQRHSDEADLKTGLEKSLLISHALNQRLEEINTEVNNTMNAIRLGEKINRFFVKYNLQLKPEQLPRFRLLHALKEQCYAPHPNETRIKEIEKEAQYHTAAIKLGLTITEQLNSISGGHRGKVAFQFTSNKKRHYFEPTLQARINTLILFERLCYDPKTDIDEITRTNFNLIGLTLHSDGFIDLEKIHKVADTHWNHICTWAKAHFSLKVSVTFSTPTYALHNDIYENLPEIISQGITHSTLENTLHEKIVHLKKQLSEIDVTLKLSTLPFVCTTSNIYATESCTSTSTHTQHIEKSRSVNNTMLQQQRNSAFNSVISCHQQTMQKLKTQLQEKIQQIEATLTQTKLNVELGALQQETDLISQSLKHLEEQIKSITFINILHKEQLKGLAHSILFVTTPTLIPILLTRLTNFAENLRVYAEKAGNLSKKEHSSYIESYKSLVMEQGNLIQRILHKEFHALLTPPMDPNRPENDLIWAEYYAVHTEDLLTLLADSQAKAEDIDAVIETLNAFKKSVQLQLEMDTIITNFLIAPWLNNANNRISALQKLRDNFNSPSYNIKPATLHAETFDHMNAIGAGEEIMRFLERIKDKLGDKKIIRVLLLEDLVNQLYDATLTGAALDQHITEAKIHMDAITEGLAISAYLGTLKGVCGLDKSSSGARHYYDEEPQARINSLILLESLCYDPHVAINIETFELIYAISDVFGVCDTQKIKRIAQDHRKNIDEWAAITLQSSNKYKRYSCHTFTCEALHQIIWERKINEIKKELQATMMATLNSYEKLEQREVVLKTLVDKTQELANKAEEFRRKAETLHESFLPAHELIYKRMKKGYDSLNDAVSSILSSASI